ncbi:EmrB/QacA subfamily drug resistance transporter [Virgibacillus natechei]|uniref:EmrB/QacA subfamily drug resistance transporter n=1 Tax=Virgibacillus natechei TaxID=1216297 RepID=A0ABS4IHU8_9BACI|nr:DHA2 family efflux MFS transporter permease subunit [Virgibacillus natechei]MBP1970527.1 EmrB/QacA subfamily drug resistance transporter [Virgibacillus natechei]UZD14070.1 DHA2 family efflux MFS transporter permease subunit [Virgibacillus natechei]
MVHNQVPPRSGEPSINRVPLMIVLISGAFVAILNQTLLGTALPHIMADLNLNANTAQWLQSIFMLVNGIMIPVTAFLIGRFTTRGLFLTAMTIFGLGTLICAIAPTFSVLMAGRVLQAAGAGIIMPLMQTILFLVFPVEKRGTAMGMFGLVIAFAPAIGPTLSGYLVQNFPWRSLFYVIMPIVIIDIIVAYFILKNVTKQTNPKVDVLSIMLSTLGFGGLLYGFSTAGDSGWTSAQVIISMFVGAITLTWFILRQLKLETPILEFRIFKYKVFTITTILGMTVFIAMIGAAVVLPLLMQNMLGFTALESGLALMPGAILMGIMNPITGRLFDKFGARWLSIIGLSILTITTFMFTNLTVQTTFSYIAIVNAVRMLGVAMVMMPVTTAGLNQLPEDLIPHGTAMNNTMRQVAGAVGTALLVTVMSSAAIPDEGVQGAIHGVNVSFIVAGVTAIVGLVLAFFIKGKSRAAESN